MKFLEASALFDSIESTHSRLKMTELLAAFFKKISSDEIEIICNFVLGTLHPPYIGTQFGMAEKNVVKAVALLLQITENSVHVHLKKEGDIGRVVALYEWTTESELTICQLYKKLCILEELAGVGSQEAKINYLCDILRSLDPCSAKYVVRMVIGKLRLGFSDMTLVDALSWMIAGDKSVRNKIEHAYNICADIGHIASELKQYGLDSIEKKTVEVGIPIRPASAERLPTAQAIFDKIGPCVAQPKLDGFRLQIHINHENKKPTLTFFSRNLQNMSAMFPDLEAGLFALPVTTMIIEGEAIGFDQNTQNFLPFQETVKRKRKYAIEKTAEEFPLKLFLFDLLYLNGQNMLSYTHEQRRQKLLSIMKHTKDERILLIEEEYITDVQQLTHYFTQMVAIGLEGLVVKRPDAPYQPGKRNFNWIKLKRQEEGHLEDTIDCVILGYYRGQGKRSIFGIGAFLVGVYNKELDCFQTVAKVGTGLTDHEWKQLKQKCDDLITKEQPKNVDCSKNVYPDVWIIPQIICIVRADEITLSPVHTAGKAKHQLGYALRFPRSMGYRSDKGPYEATTVTELKRLYEDQ